MVSGKSWGSVVAATRLEKLVDSKFVTAWSYLITKGLRAGDGFMVSRDRIANKSANEIFRRFLTDGEQDSVCLIDSDADFGPEILEELRTLKEGWEFDILQAFYVRRGWPPEAIWFKENALGDIVQAFVLGENTEEVAMVGFHFTLIRREVLERLYEENGEKEGIAFKDFEWAWYPRHESFVEDAAFSLEARELGFRCGATSIVKTGHNVRVTTGWETYHQFLEYSGQLERIDRFTSNLEAVAEYTKEDKEMIRAKALRGSANIREGVEAYLFRTEDKETISELTPEEARAFYGESDSGYFYELIAWNSTPLYYTVAKLLEEIEGASVLVVGGGIGGEVEALKDKNAVVVFELPGALREFLLWRYAGVDNVKIYTEPSDLREIIAPPEKLAYDYVVAIDTLEHIHPEDLESTLDRMLELTKPEGFLFFRNNFGQLDDYPIHFDSSEAYSRWIKINGLELYAGYDNGVEIYRRSVGDEDKSKE